MKLQEELDAKNDELRMVKDSKSGPVIENSDHLKQLLSDL